MRDILYEVLIGFLQLMAILIEALVNIIACAFFVMIAVRIFLWMAGVILPM